MQIEFQVVRAGDERAVIQAGDGAPHAAHLDAVLKLVELVDDIVGEVAIGDLADRRVAQVWRRGVETGLGPLAAG